ncbi:MAG: ABC transporter permease [Proteobacteria bacterium]|nr:ABC transporter permease [Pseudomonadota bacterium]HQR02823.1 ABC transporter permease [Rhodocyclaceae bacterium]
MTTFLLRRLGHGLFVLLAMALLVFIAVYAIGNPVDLLVDPQADAADRARAIHALGLDQSLPRQFVAYLGHALRGDLGNSFVYGTPALSLIMERLPATLELAGTALFVAILAGLPLGLWAGTRQGPIRQIIDGLSLLGFSLPTFWSGLLLILIFAVTLGWLPPGGRGETHVLYGISLSIFTPDGWRHLILPASTLALFNTALLVRLVTRGTADGLTQEYARYAKARGLPPGQVLTGHVLPNILIPVITVLGLEFGSTIAFAVVTETLFGWPGMGKLLIDAIGTLDRPVIVAYLLVTTTLFVTINLGVDLLYMILDPRVRLGNSHG